MMMGFVWFRKCLTNIALSFSANANVSRSIFLEAVVDSLVRRCFLEIIFPDSARQRLYIGCCRIGKMTVPIGRLICRPLRTVGLCERYWKLHYEMQITPNGSTYCYRLYCLYFCSFPS